MLLIRPQTHANADLRVQHFTPSGSMCMLVQYRSLNCMYSYASPFLQTSTQRVPCTWCISPVPIPSSHCSPPPKPGVSFYLLAIRASEHVPFRKHMRLRLHPHPHVHVHPSPSRSASTHVPASFPLRGPTPLNQFPPPSFLPQEP